MGSLLPVGRGEDVIDVGGYHQLCQLEMKGKVSSKNIMLHPEVFLSEFLIHLQLVVHVVNNHLFFAATFV
jgi:hypothetical protein